MRQFRLVALLPLLGAAACYNDAPAQSTFAQQQYVSGPPGGAMDPEPATYAGDPTSAAPNEPGGQLDDDEGGPGAVSEAAPPAEARAEGPAEGPIDITGQLGPSDGDPGVGVQGGLVGPGVGPGAEPAGAPTAGVTDVEIDQTLQGYGQWIESDDYGQVWRPDATVVGVDFTPYESGGSWAYTDAGWGFNCDYNWGWLPFHYGRWAWFHDYWGWVPGHRWAPAWVDWRHGGGVVGWRPTAPQIRDHRGRGIAEHHFGGGGATIRDHRHAEQHDANWRFASTADFNRPHIRSHLYGNPAEGLRVTTRVAAPPLRARTTVSAGELMRNRYQPAQGVRANPRYQAYRPQRPYAPNESWRRPQQGQQGQQGGRVYQGGPSQQPGRTWQPSRTQPYNPGRFEPGRGYQQPPRAYQQPQRTYQPPPRAYQQPQRTYQPAQRTWQPSSRPFTPSTPSGAPSRSWAPPAAPPSRSSMPSAPPSHSSSPSSGGHGSSGGGGGGGGHSSSGSSGGGNSGGHSGRH